MNIQPRDLLPHKPQTLRLVVSMGGIEYIIGDLSFNVKENQLYYLLHWPSESKDTQRFLNENIDTSRVNKISFHKESIHIKVEVETAEKVEERKLLKIDRKFLPIDKKPKLLFVESFVLENNPASILPSNVNLISRLKPDHQRTITTLKDVIDFGLVLILVPNTISIDDLMTHTLIEGNGEQAPLAEFKKENHTIGRIIAFDGYDLVIFTTPYAHKIDPSVKNMPKGPSRGLNYVEPQQSLIKMLANRNETK